MIFRGRWGLLAGVMVLAAFAACGSGGEDGSPPVVEIQARWATALGADLDTLVESSDLVFVGVVEERTGEREAKVTARGSVPVGEFLVGIEEVLSGDAPGETLTIEQVGGVKESASGPVKVRLEADTPIEVGARYVFFANEGEGGAYTAPPFGRLPIVEGVLQEPDGWERLGAVAQIAGLALPQAMSEVQSAQ